MTALVRSLLVTGIIAVGAVVAPANAADPASPAIAGGRLVIGTQDGRIYCLG